MPNGAQSPKNSPEVQQQPQENLDVPKLDIDKHKKEFLDNADYNKKRQAFMETLKPLLTKGYCLTKSGDAFVLMPRSVATRETALKAQETKERAQVKATVDYANAALRAMQNPKTPGQKLKNPQNQETYVLSNLCLDGVTDLMTMPEVANAVSNSSLSTFEHPDKLTVEALKAHPSGHGTLSGLLAATENATGADATQREEALKTIVDAIKSHKEAGFDAGAATGQLAKEGTEAVQGAWTFLTNTGPRHFFEDMRQNGWTTFFNSTPKLSSLFGLGVVSLLPTGKSKILKGVKYALMGIFGINYMSSSMGGGDLGKGLGNFFANIFGSHTPESTDPAPAVQQPDKKDVAPTGVETRTIPASMLALLRSNGLDNRDIEIVQRYTTAPVSEVMKIVGVDQKSGTSGDQWDIHIDPMAGNVFTPQQKEQLKKGPITAEQVSTAYYHMFASIGRKWRQDMVETMQNGNQFLADRTDAYRGWMVMRRVFTESQNRLNNAVKKYVRPDQNFTTASYLLLENSTAHGNDAEQNNMRDAVKEISRVYREENLHTQDPNASKNTWESYTAAHEPQPKADKAPAKPAASNGQEAGPRSIDSLRTGEKYSREKRINDLKKAGYYTKDQLGEAGTAVNQTEEYLSNRVGEIVLLLQQGGAEYHADAGAANSALNQAVARLQQVREEGPLYIHPRNAQGKLENGNPNYILDTILIRVYESQRMMGYEEMIEELIARLNLPNVPPMLG